MGVKIFIFLLVFASIAVMTNVIIMASKTKNAITKGEVCDKQFIPSHLETYPIFLTYNIDITTSFEMADVRTYLTKDIWLVSIKATDEKGRERTADYVVPEDVYLSIKIGDEFVCDPQRDSLYIPSVY